MTNNLRLLDSKQTCRHCGSRLLRARTRLIQDEVYAEARDAMKILVDADACPRQVLQICMDVGRKHDVEVWTVASFAHHIDSDHHVVVSNDPQEVDIKVINMTEEDDIVVTQDWGLAAVVLGKGARSLSPAGKEFRSHRIQFLLEEREIKNRFRRGGGRTKGPKKRTFQDDQRFGASLERMLSKTRKKVTS